MTSIDEEVVGKTVVKAGLKVKDDVGKLTSSLKVKDEVGKMKAKNVIKKPRDSVNEDADPVLGKVYSWSLKESTEKGKCKHLRYDRMYNYGGLVNSYISPEKKVLQSIRKMETRPSDVFVVSFPKAGTTWTQEITYLIKTKLDFETSRKYKLDHRFPFLEFYCSQTDSMGHEILKNMPEGRQRFIKSHMPLDMLPEDISTTKPKIIYVTRNPKDVVVSLFYFSRDVLHLLSGSFADFVDDFINERLEYCPFFEQVITFYEESKINPNLLFVTYEALKKDFTSEAGWIASFLGHNLNEEELFSLEGYCNFDSMRRNSKLNYKNTPFMDQSKTQFMRKGVIGDWRNHFSKESNAAFDAYMKEKMKDCDLVFDFGEEKEE